MRSVSPVIHLELSAAKNVVAHAFFSSAAKTLRVEVSKNSSTALSSHEGAFVTSTTICAPVSASVKPFQVIESMPLEGDAATTSCTKEAHYFASDEARAAQDDYFHILIFAFRCRFRQLA